METNVALIVVDVQQGLFNKKTKVYKEVELIENINSIIEKFRKEKHPIIFIRHTNKSMLIEGSDNWQIHYGVKCLDSDTKINKSKSNVFNEKTLPKLLKEKNVTEIVVVGLVTHGCVKAACLSAKKIGLGVTLIGDAHSSFNINAKELINEWNDKLTTEGIKVISTKDLIN